MKKVIYLFVGLLTLILVASCNNEEPVVVDPGAELIEVSFEINNYFPDTESKDLGKADDDIPDCSDLDADYVIAVINGADFKLKLVTLNGGLETEVVKLLAGNYDLQSFIVYAADNTPIYASPEENSYYQALWGLNGVTETFKVEPFTKMKVKIDVLCYQPYDYEKFGFVWFEYAKFEVKTICFFGNVICTDFFDEWHESHLNDDQEEINPYFGQPYDGYDFPAIFSVVIKDADGNVVNDLEMNSNAEWLGTGSPLCIEYPDLVGNAEDFTAEIWLDYPNGSSVLIETVPFTDANWSGADGEANFGGSDGIYDFVYENCSYDEEEKEVSCETAFAYIDDELATCFLDLGFSRWGWTIGALQAQTDAYIVDIYAAAGQCDRTKGTLVGNLTIEYDGSTAVVTYNMNSSDYTMNEVQLYVGNVNLPSDNGTATVAPGQYGNIDDDLDGASTYSFTINGLSGDIYVVAHAVVCGNFPEEE